MGPRTNLLAPSVWSGPSNRSLSGCLWSPVLWLLLLLDDVCTLSLWNPARGVANAVACRGPTACRGPSGRRAVCRAIQNRKGPRDVKVRDLPLATLDSPIPTIPHRVTSTESFYLGVKARPRTQQSVKSSFVLQQNSKGSEMTQAP